MNRNLLSAFALATLLAAPTFAGRPGGPPPPPPDELDGPAGEVGARMAERQAERLTRALDLTAAQQATLADLQATFGDAIRPLLDSMRATRDELAALLDAANPDAAAVGAKAIALHQAKEALKGAHEAFEAGIIAMLTETQRAQYEALQDARPDRGHRLREHRGRTDFR